MDIQNKLNTAATQISNIVGFTALSHIPKEEHDTFKDDLITKEDEVKKILENLNSEIIKEYKSKIIEYQGTTRDLKAIPKAGNIVMFLRGSLRPIWGLAVLFGDYMIYSGTWSVASGTLIETAFFGINFLVLGFLFGERAIKNILPLVTQYFNRK